MIGGVLIYFLFKKLIIFHFGKQAAELTVIPIYQNITQYLKTLITVFMKLSEYSLCFNGNSFLEIIQLNV